MDSHYQDSTAYQTHRAKMSPGESASKFLFTEESDSEPLRLQKDTPMEGITTFDISDTRSKMDQLVLGISSVKIEEQDNFVP